MASTLTIHLDDLAEARMRLVAHDTGLPFETVASNAVATYLANASRRPEPRMVCPTCRRSGPSCHLTCNRPDCVDGRQWEYA